MESPSAPAHRRRVPWQWLLLAVSLFTVRSPPTTAQLTLESVPPKAAEGKDVLLLVHNVPKNPGRYSWYKGESVDSRLLIASYLIKTQISTPGPAYSGRETIHHNGSLLFQNVSVQDTGYYTMEVITEDLVSKRATGQLRVYQPMKKPTVQARNTVVTEHKDTAVLTCLTNDNGISIQWLLNDQGLRLTERMKLSQDNSSLSIDPVRREDSGGYQCEISNLVSSSRSEPLRLDVQDETNSSGSLVGIIAGSVSGVLAVVVLATSLGYFLYLRRTRRASDTQAPERIDPRASTPGQGPSGTSTSPGPPTRPQDSQPHL